MDNKAGKRIRIDSESHPKLNGAKGYSLAFLPGSTPPSYRVAFDDGTVGDLPGIILEPIETDATEELTRQPLPPIQTEREQLAASIHAARVYQLMEYQRERIADVEAKIKQAQTDLANAMRADYADLYESQRVIAAVYAQHIARVEVGAETVWFANGQPKKGKTYGAAQIAEEWQLTQFNPEAALAYARTQAPNLIQTSVDPDRFKKAVRDGLLTNVPPEACTWQKTHTVKILKTALNQLALSPLPAAEDSE